ncbi:unnamed protein product [Kluyveromyces dobzhanskii CBS 2104]|uniref:WGS project CCBQ000000000 data, contig 00099 n=1 Tax=Kluyveromyces dobzhanskii CBS 2104 TaxID=1427455 RepID=A0A0A8L528_9SACH|nr:unnamed protein product [Kluyveromyces dobzhanskii CBS 2104]
MLDWTTILKYLVAASVVVATSIWFVNSVIIESKRDLHTISLNAQSNVESVRKEHETAIYRNLLVPTSFPLTTGLNLSIGYRLRNGNFSDLWSAIMANGGSTILQFHDEETALVKINSIAKQITERVSSLEAQKVGIATFIGSSTGFSVGVAGLMLSLESCIPWFLHSIPREDLGIDVLFINDWKSTKYLNGSEKWYKMVVVCDWSDHRSGNCSENIISIKEFIGQLNDCSNFEYDPKDSSDDAKVLTYVLNPFGGSTSFTQMCLVSSVSSFIKSFPLGHSLDENDHLTISTSSHWNHSLSVQSWTKVLSTLLHGGSVSFIKEPRSLNDLPRKTTLLAISGDSKFLDHVLTQSKGIRTSLSKALFSEGVFNKIGQISNQIDKLRCIYVLNDLKEVARVTDFSSPIPELKNPSITRYSTSDLTLLRSLFGSRIVMEVYSPFTIMGPLSHTNYYDYRVLPSTVDDLVTCYGSFTTSLEAKLVDTKENPKLFAKDRQGMLVIRGFTIGKPVDEKDLSHALELVKKFNGGEGWMPLLGVFGLFGNDGCFYEYK